MGAVSSWARLVGRRSPRPPPHVHTHSHNPTRADKYGDLPLGLYLVRGDAMVMLGEVDPAREAGDLTKVSSDVSDSCAVGGRRVVGGCMVRGEGLSV